jgi:hypothetical protein
MRRYLPPEVPLPLPTPPRVGALVLLFTGLCWVAGSALWARVEPSRLPASLRDTGLYEDWERKRVDPRNLAFEPQYPLWSDGSQKRRWVFIPPGTQIDARAPDDWVFPVGTRFWKEFRFGRRVETRLIQRMAHGWAFGAYVWDEGETEALLAPEQGIPDHHELEPGLFHTIPGAADCRACHQGRPPFILGFSTLQLSADRDPLAPGRSPDPDDGRLDLQRLVSLGLLRGLPPGLLQRPPRIVASTASDRAALGYLHGNCGNCHNAVGPLADLGLVLWHRVDAAPGAPEPAVETTVRSRARWRPAGAEQDAVRVVPGAPAHSALWVRMATRNPLVQMPPLGTRKVDPAGSALVEQWIAGLSDQAVQPGRSQ